MNEHNENMEALTPELSALDAGLAELGAADRAGAPSGLEGRIIAATSGLLAAPKPLQLVRTEPRGIIGRLSVKRLDWPMRAAAVIAVMIGGWAVINGSGGPGGAVPAQKGNAEAEQLLTIWSALEKTGASEKIQNLLMDAANLESLVVDNGLGETDTGEQENI